MGQIWRALIGEIALGWRVLRRRGPSQIQFWLIALIIGIAAGFVTIGFRVGIEWLQETIYRADDRALSTYLSHTHWGWVVGIPVAGGLVVGLIYWVFDRDGHVQSVADVIEGASLRNGRVNERSGLVWGLVSLVTLSTGGSSGREGPVVHLASVISSWVSNRIRADGITARDLMGCAVAAAVSASFNAPIAGAIFALEVILRHFAIRAFAPIVIASVAGTVVSRLQMGNVTEFSLPAMGHNITFELPAFLLLGVVSGLMAYVLIRSIFVAEDVADRIHKASKMPVWMRPALAGLGLGLLAIWFPHIIGVGYETTSKALTGQIGLWVAISFVAVKVVAVAITLAGRMGGGIFSPSLMVGALTGIAFGHIATGLAPSLSGSETLYAMAGMGAVAAAVLGAPISTTLIVFELTGDWQAGIAVMVAVSLSSALGARLVNRSFFLSILKRRGVHLADGPQTWLLSTISVGRLMRALGADDGPSETVAQALLEQGVSLTSGETLDAAMGIFERGEVDYIPVVSTDEPPQILGAVFEIDALKALNRALSAVAREEHS